MAGRWRSLVLVGVLIVGVGGVTAFASHRRSASPTSSGPAATDVNPDPTTNPSASVPPAPPTVVNGATTATGPTPTPAKAASSTTPSPRASSSTASTRAVTPASGAAPLAGRIRPGATYTGVATFYAATGAGACSFDASADLLVAAMNHTDYETSKACGARVQVRSAGGATVTVRIVDECPECAVGQLDLSREAFARLADPTLGRIPISWTLLSPDLGGLSIRYKSGSSRYWCGIQVIDHRDPVARLEVEVNGQFTALSRTDYNYFLSPGGAGCGAAIRITDIYGEALSVPALTVQPDVTQKTGLQFARH